MKSKRKLLSNGSSEQGSSSQCLMESVIEKFCLRRGRKNCRAARPRRNQYSHVRRSNSEQQDETSLLDQYINDRQWEAALKELKAEETYRIEHAFEAMVVEYCRSSSSSSPGRVDPPSSRCNENAICFYDDDSVQHQRSENDMRNECSTGNENILMKSCRLGAPIQIIEKILSLFPDMILSIDPMSGKTPLHCICEGSNASLETIQTLCKQLLIQAPSRILHRDYAGLNALHVALKHGAPQEIVSYLSDICSNLQTCFKWY